MDENRITASLYELQLPTDQTHLADAKRFAPFIVSEILVALEKEEVAPEVLDWRQYN